MPTRSARPSTRHTLDPHDRRPRRWPGSDQGQTTVLVALVLGLAVLLVVGVAQLGAAAVDRAQARTAADAAALAGVVEEGEGAPGTEAGRRSATEVAARNGAELTGYRVDGMEVEVRVRVDDAHATARAELADPPER